MLLDNYYKTRRQNTLSMISSDFVTDLGLQVTLSNGTSYELTRGECGGGDHLLTCISPSFVMTTIPPLTNLNYLFRYIVFGTGDTPVSTSDYSIAGTPINNISSVTIEGVEVNDTSRIIYVFKNNNTSPITIKEVCIYDNFGSTNQTGRKFALWREVFDTPFEVPAGSVFTYNFDIDFTTEG